MVEYFILSSEVRQVPGYGARNGTPLRPVPVKLSKPAGLVRFGFSFFASQLKRIILQ